MPLPGGPSDKLGNRYELWWTVVQLERMLHGEINSIRIEDPGIDKAEFAVQVAGHRELHQSKRSHPSGKWSVASLAAADIEILQAIFGQLRGNNDEFVFVSESHAGELAELAHRACSAQTAQEFEGTFLQANEATKIFERLRTAWQSCDTETAWGILRRVQVRSTDERSLSERVHVDAQALFLADPNNVCSALRIIALDSVHQTVTRDDLVERLKESGLVLRRLVDGAHATAVVTEATNRYLEGTRPRLIRHVPLRRAATDILVSKLRTDAGDSVVTGRAGVGKTGCIVDFVERLRTRGIPVLAFRLDRIEPVSTALELGRKLGFEESPALILAAAAHGREAVLIVDQLDVVSTTSGRATSFLEAVEGLLIEARGLRHRLPLHVVVACREFDWKNDHRLRTMLPKDHTEVPVVEFTLGEVTETLIATGFDTTRFQTRQLELLRLPQNLSLFLESGFNPARPPVFNTVIELFDRYWDQKQRAVSQRAAPAGDFWAEVIRVLVEKMAATQQLSVTREMLDHVPVDYIDQMASEGVVSLDGRRYAFGHESFFDYCFARSYVRADQTLVSFLTSSEQHLFRRAQVRQVLTYMRDADHQRYLREMHDLIRNPGIRPHLKSLTVALLADVPEPTDEEWAMWEQLLRPFFKAAAENQTSMDKLANMSWRHFFSSPSWFRYTAHHGLVAKWLSSGDGMVEAAMQYLRLHERHSSDLVVEFLEPYVGLGGKWSARLTYIVQWSDKVGSRRFFDFVLRLIGDGTLDEARGPIAANSTFWSMFYSLGQKRPEWIPEVLAHWLRRRTGIAKVEGKDLKHDPEFNHDQFADEPIGQGAKNAPSRFVEHVLPVVLEISDEATDLSQEPPTRNEVWACLFKHTGPLGATFEGLETSLSSLAKDPAVDLSGVISELRSKQTYLANFLLLALYAANGARFADEAATLISEQPWRFRCGLSNSPYWTAMELISAIVPHTSAEGRNRLENAVLNYSPSFERRLEGYKAAGHACFTLLSAIPNDARSPSANVRYRELERKFHKPDVAPRDFTGGWVGSPVESKAADRMTDEQWLGALTKHCSEHGELRRVDGALKGGAIELARQLQTHVEKEPERFARLALRFPMDTHWAYHEHLLNGLEKAATPSSLKLDVCRKAYADCREKCGAGIATVLGRIEDPLPDDAIAMLDWLATEHPDPQTEHWQTEASNGNAYYRGDLNNKGINTTRGRAVGAIGDLILKDAAYIERFDTSLARMVQDPSAAVRSCVGWTLRAVAHHDITLGLSFLSQMNLSEDCLLATPHMDNLIAAALPEQFEQVRPVVERMLRSQEPDVAESGARLAALSSLYHPEEEVLEAEAFAGTARQRLGVAKVAAANIGSENCRSWCEERLLALFNDADQAVRKEASTSFRRLEHAALENYADLIGAFCDSQAFHDDSFSILHVLEQSLQRLPGMTCIVCEKFIERFSDEARDIRKSRMGDAYTVIKLLFRTYQQHQQDEWTTTALDLIDRLCLESIQGVDDRFRAFER
jgi:hypothetical protein